MRTGGDSWGWGEAEHSGHRHGLLADFCLSFCNSITSWYSAFLRLHTQFLLNFFCCCWLLRDCFGGRYRNPYAPSPALPFGPSLEHHSRPTDPFMGPGPAPSRFGAPGVPGPLAGEDPPSFGPPGPAY